MRKFRSAALFLVLACALFVSTGVSFATAQSIAEKLKGKILLQVESRGEAWYVSPDTGTRSSLGRPADAFRVMRERGIGITDADLRRIPIGILTPELVSLIKTDATSEQVYSSTMKQLELCTNALLNSGTPESYTTCYVEVLEKLVGMKLTEDSDKDGYDDITEILNDYDPFGPGKMPIDPVFTKKMSGRILLQVQQKGEAWYVDPKSGKRFFLGRPQDAFALMRGLGLGISNANIEKIKKDGESQTVPYRTFEDSGIGIRFQYPKDYPTPVVERFPRGPNSGIFWELDAPSQSIVLGHRTTGGALEGEDDYLHRIYVYQPAALTYEKAKELVYGDELTMARNLEVRGRKAIILDQCGEYCSAEGMLFFGHHAVHLEMRFMDSSQEVFTRILESIDFIPQD